MTIMERRFFKKLGKKAKLRVLIIQNRLQDLNLEIRKLNQELMKYEK